MFFLPSDLKEEISPSPKALGAISKHVHQDGDAGKAIIN